MNNYFKILGINANATKAQIKAAFRRKAKLYHPDISTEPNAAERFIEVNEAYELLIDDKKRRIYMEIKERNSYNRSRTRSESEQARAAYAEWQYQAKQQARQNAKMKYKEFTHSIYYRGIVATSNVLFFLAMGIGILLMIAPVIFALQSGSTSPLLGLILVTPVGFVIFYNGWMGWRKA